MSTFLRNLWARLTRQPYRYISLPNDTIRLGVALGLMRHDGRVVEFTPKGDEYFRQYLERELSS